MAIIPPFLAWTTAALIVFQGAVADPSLVPTNARSTYTVPGSTGMVPQGASPQGMTSWQAVSPGTAIIPLSQGALGIVATQAPAPSASKPSAHASGGTPGA